MSTNGTAASPAPGVRKVVAGLPPWCSSLRYTNGAIVLTGRVPVPPMDVIEQLAWQRDQYDEHATLSQIVIGSPPAISPTFELGLTLSEEQAGALRDALDQLLAAAEKARAVVDVVDVVDVD